MIRLLFIPLLLFPYIGITNELANAAEICCKIQVDKANSSTMLMGIEAKIYENFVQCLMQQEHKPLLELSNELEELISIENESITLYWRSYLQFYSSIYFLKRGEKENSEKAIDKGVDWLNGIQTKSSEDYALLAMLQGFSIQFKWAEAERIAVDIKENIKQAIALDSTNLRAHYIFASNKFYSPNAKDSSKEVELHLLKAISLPAQSVKNSTLPSWGKEESFEMLIKFYIKNEDWGLAKKYYEEGINEFPESYTINQLTAQLAGK